MRDDRQKKVHDWCVAAFGTEQATSLPQRGIRLLEETVELFQAVGGDAAMAHHLVDYVFARPVGDVFQELGGVGVTVLALAQAAGLSADECEQAEVARVLAKSLDEFKLRNLAKNAAGFNATVKHKKVEITEEARSALGCVARSLDYDITMTTTAFGPEAPETKRIEAAYTFMIAKVAGPVAEIAGHCEACSRLLFVGDLGHQCHDGPTLCEEHAPTWSQLLADYEGVPDADIDPEALQRSTIEKRIADGDGDKKHVWEL